MDGGLDFASLYDQSGPALLGVLNLLVLVVWYDVRTKVGNAEDEASDAVEEASEAKEKASQAARKNDRQELLIDQVANDVDELEDAVQRNDQRIQQVRQRQAASQGDDFFRGDDGDAIGAESDDPPSANHEGA